MHGWHAWRNALDLRLRGVVVYGSVRYETPLRTRRNATATGVLD